MKLLTLKLCQFHSVQMLCLVTYFVTPLATHKWSHTQHDITCKIMLLYNFILNFLHSGK